jgi:hypothetical protein
VLYRCRGRSLRSGPPKRTSACSVILSASRLEYSALRSARALVATASVALADSVTQSSGSANARLFTER